MRGVVEYAPRSSTICAFAPWRRGGHRLALDVSSGGCGQGGDGAIPKTSTGSRNDRRVPDDAMANGSGGALPTTRVHHGAQPGGSARVRGGVDESPHRRAPIRRWDCGYTPVPTQRPGTTRLGPPRG